MKEIRWFGDPVGTLENGAAGSESWGNTGNQGLEREVPERMRSLVTTISAQRNANELAGARGCSYYATKNAQRPTGGVELDVTNLQVVMITGAANGMNLQWLVRHRKQRNLGLGGLSQRFRRLNCMRYSWYLDTLHELR